MKSLIVNADDFGYSKGINEGIIKAFKEGIVTSTSLMIYGEAVKEAAELAKKNPDLGLGLHFQIENYDWNLLWQLKKVVAAISIDNTKKEFLKQIKLFKDLTGKMPDHIDGHHHVHKTPRIYQFIQSYCLKNDICMRGDVNFIHTFYGDPNIKAVSADSLIKILGNLPDGTSELMCHPGFVSSGLMSSYSKQREIELESLTSSRIIEEVKKLRIKLINWTGYKAS